MYNLVTRHYIFRLCQWTIALNEDSTLSAVLNELSVLQKGSTFNLIANRKWQRGTRFMEYLQMMNIEVAYSHTFDLVLRSILVQDLIP